MYNRMIYSKGGATFVKTCSLQRKIKDTILRKIIKTTDSHNDYWLLKISDCEIFLRCVILQFNSKCYTLMI